MVGVCDEFFFFKSLSEKNSSININIHFLQYHLRMSTSDDSATDTTRSDEEKLLPLPDGIKELEEDINKSETKDEISENDSKLVRPVDKPSPETPPNDEYNEYDYSDDKELDDKEW